jgi:hypothetical protein
LTDAHSDRPSGNGGSTVDGIRDFFTLWLGRLEDFYTERDRRYEDRFRAVEGGTAEKFRAAEVAVAAALAAQEKAVAAAFLASEKAIIKAESAQTSYNERSNEFRAALDDSAKLQLPRAEAATRFTDFDRRLEELKKNYDQQIASLRESRSEGTGSQLAQRESRDDYTAYGMGFLGVAAIVASIVIAVTAK